MTPAERDEVLRIAAGFFACEPKDALTMAGMIKLCNAVLRYVPPGEAASARLTEAMAVDRPAHTPTTAPGLDLDAVERAERAMMAGPWSMRRESHFVQIRAADLEELATTEQARGVDVANAAGIVALRNAAPALIAEVRALRAEVAERRETASRQLAAIGRVHDRISARLAEAKRLADDALLIAEHEPTCAIGPDGQDADCNCRRAAIAAALEAL